MHQLSHLAQLVGGEIHGDPNREVVAVRTLDTAGPEDLSFLANSSYKDAARLSSAGVLLVREVIEGLERDFLVVSDPYLALGRILDELYPLPEKSRGIDPTAIVDPSAKVSSSTHLGPYSVVGEGSDLGADVQVGPHVVIGRNCHIGEGSILYPRVVLYDGTAIGRRCILHSGVVLGSDGFGYAQSDDRHVKLRHAGRVVVEDDVEIGANSTVDRALLDETRIGAGTKIDNLVQVAHNVRLGRGCLLVSQSGIAGSSRLGDGVVVAGQSGVSGHMVLGDGVRVAAKSAVFKSVAQGKQVAGIPAVEVGRWRRQQALVGRLDELRKRLLNLEARLSSIEVEEENID